MFPCESLLRCIHLASNQLTRLCEALLFGFFAQSRDIKGSFDNFFRHTPYFNGDKKFTLTHFCDFQFNKLKSTITKKDSKFKTENL